MNKKENEGSINDDIPLSLLIDDEILRMIVKRMKEKAGEIVDEMRTGRLSEENGEIVSEIIKKVLDNLF